ncbi:oligoendopeptidase F, partial [bacterium]|nr:oligoendopeptidase F [bacterium]
AKELHHGWTDNPEKMFNLLKTYDEIRMKLSRLYIYSSLNNDSDMNEPEYTAMQGEIHHLFVELGSQGSFMKPEMLELGEKKLEEYTKLESGLKDYEIKFDTIFRLQKHVLSKEAENILSMTGMFADGVNKAAEILNDMELPPEKLTLSDGSQVQLNSINYTRHRYSNVCEDRRNVMSTFWNNHAKFRNTLAALLDSAVKYDFFNMKSRSYNSCLEAELSPRKINTNVYTNLIQTVRNNLDPLHKFLKIKQNLLDIETLTYSDLYASSVPEIEKEYSIEKAKNMVIESMGILGTDYTDILKLGFENRWMDVYPNKGKRTGAYSNGAAWGVHPYVMMNFNNTFHSVMTLAHEFGHALHSWFSSRNNPYPKTRYPIFLAEIASTFNEMVLINNVIKHEEDPNLKLYLLDQELESFRTTLVRQTLFAEFELAMHSHVEQGKTLTPDWLDETYLELTRFYYGHDKGVVHVDDYIKNEWSLIPHFYYNFYVYQYATGLSAASSLAFKVLNGGEKEKDLYFEFLKSGGRDYPLNILKKATIDLESPEPILDAMKLMDSLTIQMEKFTS